jgi:hypothetical protein
MVRLETDYRFTAPDGPVVGWAGPWSRPMPRDEYVTAPAATS